MNPSLHTCPPCYPASGAPTRVAYVAMQAAKFVGAACAATPHPRTSRAILSCKLGECASHVRTDRPHPAPPPRRRLIFQISALRARGAGLARVALRPPVASLPSKGFHTPAPVRGAFVLPATHDGGFASATPFRGHPAPENPDKGYRALDHSPETVASRAPTTRACALWTTRRRPSCPCTLTGGCPLDPAAGTIRQKGGALDRYPPSARRGKSPAGS